METQDTTGWGSGDGEVEWDKKDYLQVALGRAAPTSTRSVTPRQPARSWTRGLKIEVKRLSTGDESEGNGEVEVRVVSTTVEGKGWDRSQLGPNHWHVYLQTLHLQLRNQSPPATRETQIHPDYAPQSSAATIDRVLLLASK